MRKAKGKDLRFLAVEDQYYNYEKSKFVVIPIPFEKTTTYGKGTKNGPAAILEASKQVEEFDEELGYEPYKKAWIYTLEPLSVQSLTSKVQSLLKDKKVPVILGGEHSITPYAIKAFAEKYKNLSLVSEFIRRKRELTRLSGKFKKCLLEAAEQLKIKDKIVIGKVGFKKTVGTNGLVKNIDKEQSTKFDDKISINKDRVEVEKAYYDFCGEMSSPYAKSDSSKIIKSSIRTLFKKYWNEDNEDVIGQMVLNPNNNPAIISKET